MLAKFKSIRIITWLAALLLALSVFTQLPVATLSESMANLSLMQWLIWVILNFLIILVLVARWQILANALGLSVDFTSLFLIRQAGQLVSFITPGPQFGGEPLQVYWLWKNYRVPGHAALLAVGLDRFFELWINFAVLLFAILALLLTATIDTNTWNVVAFILTLLILVLSILGWIFISHPEMISRGLQRLAGRWQQNPVLGKLDTQWGLISSNLLVLTSRHKRSLLFAFMLSVVGWAGMFSEIWLLLTFFDPTPDFTGFIVLFVAIRLAFLLPLPGGIGTLEAAVFWACQGLGLAGTAALGLIVLMRLRDAVVMTAGLLALRYLNSYQPR